MQTASSPPRVAAPPPANRTAAAAILVACLAAFWPIFTGAYVYDDVLLVERNPALQRGDLTALLTQPMFAAEHGYWRPLSLLLLFVGNALGGATGTHVLAFLLHLGNCAMVFALGTRLLERRPALWATLLFAVHPLQAEAIAWNSAINDPLWVAAALLATHAALRWRDAGGRGLPWLAAGAWLLAVLGKESGVAAVPIALAALWVVPARDGTRPPVRWWRALGSAVAVAAAWLAVRAIVFGEAPGAVAVAHERAPTDPSELLRIPEVLLRHLALLAVPWPSTPFRPLPPQQLAVALAAVAAVGAVGVAVARRWPRLQPATRLGWLLLVLPLLVPTAFFQTVGSFPVNDRYVYLATFGCALLLVRWLPWRIAWLPWLLLALPVPYTMWLCRAWHDSETLTAHALTVSGDVPQVLVTAGDLELARAQAGEPQRFAQARDYYQRAIDHTPPARGEFVPVTLSAGRLGVAWCMLFEPRQPPLPPRDVIAAFEAAIEVGPQNPAAWVGLGVAQASVGDPARAETAFRKALAIDPDHPEALFDLGRLLVLTGRNREARAPLERVLALDPDNAAARELLAQCR